MTRDEFWTLHPQEFWWLVEAHRSVRMYGRMTEDEAEQIYQELEARYGDA